MKTASGILRRLLDRRPEAHSALLGGAHLAVVAACLWKPLAVVADLALLFYAFVASLAELGIRPRDLVDLVESSFYEFERPGKTAPATETLRQAMATPESATLFREHYHQVVAGHAVAFVCTVLLLLVFSYLTLLLVRAYVRDGLQERPTDPASRAGRDRLLGAARAALPAGYPGTRLVLARETFVRHRLRGGITTFLGNWPLVLLARGRLAEFRFILAHEAFHLRSFDPLVSRLSKALRPLLLSFGVAVVFMTANRPFALTFREVAEFVLWLATIYLVVRRVGRSSVALWKHKELLADRFAHRVEPDADLALLHARSRPAESHPTRQERACFLLQGTGTTAAEAFLAAQECIACFILMISSRTFDDLMRPIPWMLDLPSYLIGLTGSLVLLVEAWIWPVPKALRAPLLARAGLVLAICALGLTGPAGGRDAAFAIAQACLIGAFAVRVASGSLKPLRQGEREGTPGAPFLGLPEPGPRRSRLDRLAQASGTILSATAFGLTLFVLGYCLLIVAIVGVFNGGLPPEARMRLGGWSDVWQTTVLVAVFALLLGAASVNLKRPHLWTLAIEWSFLVVLLAALSAYVLWLYDAVSAEDGGKAAVLASLKNPAVLISGPFGSCAGLVRWVLVLAAPFDLLIALYLLRARAVLRERREERAAREGSDRADPAGRPEAPRRDRPGPETYRSSQST